MAIEIVGAENFNILARRIDAAVARNHLVPDMRAGFEAEAPQMRQAVFRSIDTYLPTRYASVLRGTLDINGRGSASGNTARVTLVATAGGRHIGTTNAGSLRHPVFGHESAWAGQNVRRGFVSEPMSSRRQQLRQRVSAALRSFLQVITRG